MRDLFQNTYGQNPGPHPKPIEMDFITADLMRVLFKLSLAEEFLVSDRHVSMWDYDSMSNVQDHTGYDLWYAE